MSLTVTLVTTGLFCVITGIVGGPFRAWELELPALKSGFSRAALICFGIALLAWAGAAPLSNYLSSREEAQHSAASRRQAELLAAAQRKEAQTKLDRQAAEQQAAEQQRAAQALRESEKYSLVLFCADDMFSCTVNGTFVGSVAMGDCGLAKKIDLTPRLHKGDNTLQCTEYDTHPPLWSYKYQVLKGTAVIVEGGNNGSSGAVVQPPPTTLPVN